MTIRAKLFLNSIITLAIVAGLASSGIFGMNFIQNNISNLTQKSTPYQIKATELEKTVHSTVAALIRLNNSQCSDDMLASRKEVEKYLSEVKTTQESLKGLSENVQDFYSELSSITAELIEATTQRHKSQDDAARSGVAVRERVKESIARLRNLESQIKQLQNKAGSRFGKAISDMKSSSSRLRDVEQLADALKELQIVLIQLPKAEKKLQVIAARGKVSSVSGKITQNNYIKGNKKFSDEFRQLLDKLNEMVKLKMDNLSASAPEKKSRIDLLASESDALITPISIELNSEVQMLNGHYSDELKNQDDSFASSSSASTVLMATTDLVTAGMTISALSSTLLSVQELEDTSSIEAELRQTFARIASIDKMLAANLLKMNAKNEVKLLQASVASLNSIKALLDGNEGMIAKIRKSLEMKNKSMAVTKKVLEVAANATQRGRQSTTTAQGEQEHAIRSLNHAVGSTEKMIASIGVLAFVFCTVFGFWIYRSITKPLSALSRAARDVQNTGDLSIRGAVSCKGEVGQTTVAFNNLLHDLNNVINDINSVMHAVANNDLTKTVSVDACGNLDTLKQNINSTVRALQKTMGDMKENATSVATASVESSQAVEGLTASARVQLEAVSSVADALNETSATISEIAQSTDKANSLAKTSVNIVSDAKGKMAQMVQVMDEISANSERIEGISSLIAEIAEQTNLLALNAAIEAARAGDMGMGFAVVADEVKKLAQRVSESANEISQVVHESVKGSLKATNEAKAVEAVMEQVSNSSQEIEGMLQRIAAAAEEQSATVGEINENVVKLTSTAHENTAASEQMSTTMNELSRLADATGQQAAKFRL